MSGNESPRCVVYRLSSLGERNKPSLLEDYQFELGGLATIVRLLNSWTNVLNTLTLRTGVISHKIDSDCSLSINTENIIICESPKLSI
jgi:hypothetical protein